MVRTLKRSYAGTANRAFKRLRGNNGAVMAAQVASRAIRSMRGSSSRGQGFTNANDHTRTMVNANDQNASLYQRKKGKMSKASMMKKRRQKKFKNKIKNALLSDQRMSVHSDTFNNSYIYSSVITDQFQKQEVWPTTLERCMLLNFGHLTTAGCGLPYIQTTVNNIGIVDGAAAPTIAIDYGKTLYFPYKSTLKFSYWTANVEYTATNPLVTDIYECVAARDIDDVNYSTPQLAYSKCIDDGQSFAGRTVLTKSQKGMTPFNAPDFGKWWKILSVTRISSAYNVVNHYTMKGAGTYSKARFENVYAVKGLTKGIMFITEPTFQQSLPAVVYDFRLSGISVITNYKIPPKFNSGGIAMTTQVTLPV